jgi:DNA ligase-1
MEPMLSAKPGDGPLTALVWPMMMSRKLDGIRSLQKDNAATSRKFFAIPNLFVQSRLRDLPNGPDGELLTFTGGKVDPFNTIQSKIMRQDGEPDFKYMVFDDFLHPGGFAERIASAERFVHPCVQIVKHEIVYSLAEALAKCAEWVAEGEEGAMLRKLDGPYKWGRSTMNEQYLVALKHMDDAEATIIGMTEMMHNNNVATKDNLGRTKRSSAKAGLDPAGVMGTLILSWTGGTDFDIGTGFTAAERADYWNRRGELNGRIITFKYQGVGPKGRPRIPSFKGFRPEMEQSDD